MFFQTEKHRRVAHSMIKSTVGQSNTTGLDQNLPELHIYQNVMPKEHSGTGLLWNQWGCNCASILDLQTRYFAQIREEFLGFICALGKSDIRGKKLKDHFRLEDGFSTWWISSLFERHPSCYGQNLFEIFKLRALEIHLTKNPCAALHLHGNNASLAEALGQLCLALGIPFHWHTAGPKPSRSFRQRLKKALQSCSPTNTIFYAFKALHWWFATRRRFPAKPSVTPGKGLLLGTWFPNVDKQAAAKGHFRSRYWEAAHDALPKNLPVHWLFVHVDPKKKIQANVQLRDSLMPEHGKGDMTFWEECVTPSAALGAFGQWLSVAARARKLKAEVGKAFMWPDSHLNVYPHLRDAWHDSTQGGFLLDQLLCRKGIQAYCRAIGPQNACITSSELQSWERLLFEEQHRQGCPHVLAVQHSIVRDADFRFFVAPQQWTDSEFTRLMPHTFYANGKAGLMAMRHGGFAADRLDMVEAVRFMYLAEAKTLPEVEPQRLLVATSYFAKETEEMLKLLAEAANSSSAPLLNNIVIKPHPFLPVDHLVEKYFSSKPVIADGPIESHLTPGTVVFAESGTSVALLVLCRQLPLLLYVAADTFDLGIIQADTPVARIRTVQDLISALPPKPLGCTIDDYFCLDNSLPRWHELFNKIFQNGNHQ
jgi:surface carbohydrate biosynthesis protein (TIGR04326 family)